MTVDADKTIKLYQELMSEKSNFTTFFQEVTDYILPYASNTRQWESPGTRRGVERYDSTAVEACERLSASLGTTLTNASSKWFQLQAEDDHLREDSDVSSWLEASAERMYDALAQSNFYTQIDEAFLDLAGYGTACLDAMSKGLSISRGFQGLKFRAWPIREYVFAEGPDGIVNETLRSTRLSPLQAMAEFGALPGFKGLGKRMTAALDEAASRGPASKAYERHEIIHHVYPRHTRDPLHRKFSKNFEWGSAYIAAEDKHLIWESGFVERPFGLARWRKNADDGGWGRGPGLTAMPTIRSLNAFQKNMLKAAEKDVDPPLLIENKGVIGSIRTRAKGITYKRRGAEIDFLHSGTNFNFGMAELSDMRAAVKRMFHVEQIDALMGEPTPNMTAFEFGKRVDMARQQLGSTFGRLQQELLDPVILRVFGLMARSGQLPMPPEALQGSVNLKVEYVGPLARAQRSSEVDAIHQAYEFGAFLSQATGDPSPLDVLNGQKAQRHASRILGVPSDIIRGEEEVAGLQEARSQQAQEQTAIEQADTLAGAAQKVGSIA